MLSDHFGGLPSSKERAETYGNPVTDLFTGSTYRVYLNLDDSSEDANPGAIRDTESHPPHPDHRLCGICIEMHEFHADLRQPVQLMCISCKSTVVPSLCYMIRSENGEPGSQGPGAGGWGQGAGDRRPALDLGLLNQLHQIQPMLIPTADADGDRDGRGCAMRDANLRTDQGRPMRGEARVMVLGVVRGGAARHGVRPTKGIGGGQCWSREDGSDGRSSESVVRENLSGCLGHR